MGLAPSAPLPPPPPRGHRGTYFRKKIHFNASVINLASNVVTRANDENITCQCGEKGVWERGLGGWANGFWEWFTGKRPCPLSSLIIFPPVGHQIRSCHNVELTSEREKEEEVRTRRSDSKLFRITSITRSIISLIARCKRAWGASYWRRFPRSIDHAANRAYRLDFGSLIRERRDGGKGWREARIAPRWIDNSWFHNCQSSAVNPFSRAEYFITVGSVRSGKFACLSKMKDVWPINPILFSY